MLGLLLQPQRPTFNLQLHQQSQRTWSLLSRHSQRVPPTNKIKDKHFFCSLLFIHCQFCLMKRSNSWNWDRENKRVQTNLNSRHTRGEKWSFVRLSILLKSQFLGFVKSFYVSFHFRSGKLLLGFQTQFDVGVLFFYLITPQTPHHKYQVLALVKTQKSQVEPRMAQSASRMLRYHTLA